jgi:ferredoxin
MGIAALVSPAKIRRRPELCIDCSKCANACPSVLPVDKLLAINSAECSGCLICVESCPSAGALEMRFGRRSRLPAWAMAAGIALLFFSLVGYAKFRGYWGTDVPSQVYFELIPRAQEFSHP